MTPTAPRMKCGWKPDREHPLGTSGLLSARRFLLGGGEPPPAAVDFRRHVTTIHDQNPMECCVGMALARAIDVRAKIQGLSIPYPAELAIYTNGRPKPLIDEGCYFRDAMAALHRRGIVASERWPLDPGKVNTPVPWDVFQHGTDALDIEFYRINSVGGERIHDLQLALAQGFIPVFGQQVDSVFEGYRTGVIGPWKGPSLGGHATALVGYMRSSGGDPLFLGVNSWGASWGQAGFYLISEERLGDPDLCNDFYVIDLAPKAVT